MRLVKDLHYFIDFQYSDSENRQDIEIDSEFDSDCETIASIQ